jgi:hypothetical protein
MSSLLDVVTVPLAGTRHSRVKNDRPFKGFLAAADA